ncbi:FAD-dependent monooxygenase [Sphingomonas sp. I4]
MSYDHHSKHSVIIAGAGPVGLFLACELRLAGCSVLVLERAPGPPSPLKALPFGLRGLTLPTIASLDRRDLLAPLKARMSARGTAAAAPWTAGARRPAGHFAGLQFFRDRVDDTAWPWRPAGSSEMLAVALADIEAVLAARATALGVTIRYNSGVDGLEQVEDGVVVHTGTERLRAGWLVGCDGGRSTVRKAAGIGFTGTEPEFTGYSMSLRLAEPNPLRPGRQHTATGMYTFAPPGTVTMVDFDGGTRHRAGPLSREHVEAVLRRISGTDVIVTALDLATTWTDRAFLAAEYRKGRVLLAGDAAHVHAPLGGQGLNLGLGDAMNLGWKLAATICGLAPRRCSTAIKKSDDRWPSRCSIGRAHKSLCCDRIREPPHCGRSSGSSWRRAMAPLTLPGGSGAPGCNTTTATRQLIHWSAGMCPTLRSRTASG